MYRIPTVTTQALVDSNLQGQFLSYLADLGTNKIYNYLTPGELKMLRQARCLKINRIGMRVYNMGVTNPYQTSSTSQVGAVSQLQGRIAIWDSANKGPANYHGEYEPRSYTIADTGNVINSTADTIFGADLVAKNYGIGGARDVPRLWEDFATWRFRGATDPADYQGVIPSITPNCMLVNANTTVDQQIADFHYEFGANDGHFKSLQYLPVNPEIQSLAKDTAATSLVRQVMYQQSGQRFRTALTEAEVGTDDGLPTEYKFFNPQLGVTRDPNFEDLNAYINETVYKSSEGGNHIIPSLNIGLVPVPSTVGTVTVPMYMIIRLETYFEYSYNAPNQGHVIFPKSALQSTEEYATKRSAINYVNAFGGRSNLSFLGQPVITVAQNRPTTRSMTRAEEEEAKARDMKKPKK